MSAGGGQTCALTAAGIAYCWGSNQRGALGIGTNDPQVADSPMRVTGGHRFRSITSGTSAVCAIAADHTGFCWGAALESEPVATRPRRVPGTGAWSHISAEGFPHCGLSMGGDVECWGTLGFIPGGSSIPSTVLRHEDTPAPIGATPGAVDLSGVCANYATSQSECMRWVFRDGEYHWQAHPVAGSIPFRRVVGSELAQCGITHESHLYCWQRNQLPLQVTADVEWAAW